MNVSCWCTSLGVCRRRKKEMFEEQQRLNVELALKCNELAKAHAQSQARTLFLEDMLNIPHQSTEPAGQVRRPWLGCLSAESSCLQAQQLPHLTTSVCA